MWCACGTIEIRADRVVGPYTPYTEDAVGNERAG